MLNHGLFKELPHCSSSIRIPGDVLVHVQVRHTKDIHPTIVR